MEMPDFFICENSAIGGAGFVLFTRSPFPLFRVLKFTQDDEDKYLQAPKKKPFIKIDGYRVYLEHTENLSYVTYTSESPMKIPRVLQLAAKFYTDEKINTNAYQFKRYKETGP